MNIDLSIQYVILTISGVLTTPLKLIEGFTEVHTSSSKNPRKPKWV